jgi:aryl-alcohol dehydrogenase-like predicted oxidoreductase
VAAQANYCAQYGPASSAVRIIRSMSTNKRFLGKSDLQITPLGLGAWAIGGSWKFGWGAQEDGDSIAAIHRALELGINWIDTAAVYGLGHSEEVVACALRDWPGERPYVFTKCGMIWDEKGEIDYSLRADSIRRECENSLRRLGVEQLDLYQIHWPADEWPETEEGLGALAELQKEGKVRWIGASNFSVEELEKSKPIAPLISLQAPYSLIKPELEEAHLPWCEREEVGVLVYSPMGSGLLTGKMNHARLSELPPDDWRRKNPEFQEPKLSENLALTERLRLIAESRGHHTAEAALAWTLRQPAVTGAIVGARSAEQVEGFIGAMDFRLNDSEAGHLRHPAGV